jgi:hypothetical protein
MLFCRFFHVLPAIVLLAVCGVISPAALAQGPAPDAPLPAVEPASLSSSVPRGTASQHKFWDKQNFSLFAAMTALNGADFAVTRSNLQSGGRELNPIVRLFGRSTPGLAVNFAGETAAVVGLSYCFHKTGHHKMERIVSLVNIASSTGAVTYGFTHR